MRSAIEQSVCCEEAVKPAAVDAEWPAKLAGLAELARRVRRSGAIRELAAYVLVGLFATAVDCLVMWTLLGMQTHYLVAGTAGFVVGVSLVYLLSTRFVFRHRAVASRRLEMLLFFGIGILGLGLNALLLCVLTDLCHLHPMVSKLVSIGAVFLFNFTARRQLLFRRRMLPA